MTSFASIYITGGAILGLAVTACAQSWDLARDFSTSQNPNGPWSYNLWGTPITEPRDGVGWGYSSSYDGSITIWGNAVAVHTYSFGGDNSITWTSPSSGYASISGIAYDRDFRYFGGGRDASWTLSINGTQVASRSNIYGVEAGDSAASFANNLLPAQSLNNIPIAEGDIIMFLPHTVTSLGSFMNVEMTIAVSATPVPEPTQWATLVGSGLITFAGWRRHKLKTRQPSERRSC
jgi:hypothetical protein